MLRMIGLTAAICLAATQVQAACTVSGLTGTWKIGIAGYEDVCSMVVKSGGTGTLTCPSGVYTGKVKLGSASGCSYTATTTSGAKFVKFRTDPGMNTLIGSDFIGEVVIGYKTF